MSIDQLLSFGLDLVLICEVAAMFGDLRGLVDQSLTKIFVFFVHVFLENLASKVASKDLLDFGSGL